MKTEAQILADVYVRTRELSRWYLSKLKDVDVHKEFEIEGKVFNPVIWEVGHLANSENFLGVYMTNGKPLRYEWAGLFGVGVSLPKKEEYPPFEELWKAYKEGHEYTVQHIKNLAEEQLDAPARKVGFAGIQTVRDAIFHLIRHEGTHIGHLGWLCKMHGVETI